MFHPFFFLSIHSYYTVSYIIKRKKKSGRGREQHCLSEAKRLTRTQRTSGPKEPCRVWVGGDLGMQDQHQAALWPHSVLLSGCSLAKSGMRPNAPGMAGQQPGSTSNSPLLYMEAERVSSHSNLHQQPL